MSRAWMPFYVGDYLRDTGHLSTVEHGAYVLLIMHYWSNGGLPTEDVKLARLCRMPLDEWMEHRDTLADFFDAEWRHKRIDAELKRHEEVRETYAARAKKAAGKRWQGRNEAGTDASSMLGASKTDASSITQAPQSQSHREDTLEASASNDAAGAARNIPDPAIAERELFERGKAVLGKSAGGMIAELLRSKGGNCALARASIEEASTKHDARQWVAGAIRYAANGKANGHGVRKPEKSSVYEVASALAEWTRNQEEPRRPGPMLAYHRSGSD